MSILILFLTIALGMFVGFYSMPQPLNGFMTVFFGFMAGILGYLLSEEEHESDGKINVHGEKGSQS